MSKLFNTLEKIRHHESSNEPARRSPSRKSPAVVKSGPPRFLSLLLVVMLGVMVLYTVILSTRLNLTPLTANFRQLLITLQLLPNPDAARSARSAASNINVPPQDRGPATTSAVEQAVQLSRTGAALFRSGDYWRSIYFFDRARQLDPQAPEPLIDMAAALSELGLFGPANRLLREASALNPDDPALRRNLAILAEAGRLDDAWQAKQPRSTGPNAPHGR